MPFEDFTLKDWKILAPGSEECKTDEIVKISRTKEGVVMIDCGGRSPYANALYNESKNRIEGEGYDIRLQIIFTPKESGGSSGGSWTAEDNPNGPAE